jgi:hypothetical protein
MSSWAPSGHGSTANERIPSRQSCLIVQRLSPGVPPKARQSCEHRTRSSLARATGIGDLYGRRAASRCPRKRATRHSCGVTYRPVGRTGGRTESTRLVLDQSEERALDGALLRHEARSVTIGPREDRDVAARMSSGMPRAERVLKLLLRGASGCRRGRAFWDAPRRWCAPIRSMLLCLSRADLQRVRRRARWRQDRDEPLVEGKLLLGRRSCPRRGWQRRATGRSFSGQPLRVSADYRARSSPLIA